MNKVIRALLLFIVLLFISLLANYAILGGAKVIKPKSNQLHSVVATSLQANTDYLPLEGVDYSVSSLRYFENKQWVVVRVTPLSTSSDPATLVLKRFNGSYALVLGPSNFFGDDNLKALPNSVSDYIKSVGK